MPTGLIQPPVNGEFYIDNENDDFYLREGGVWGWKGRIMRASAIGFYGDGPFTDAQTFPLAEFLSDLRFTAAFSGPRSFIKADAPPSTDVNIVVTDNLAAFLGTGNRAICTGTILAGEGTATTLSWLEGTIVPAGSRLWIVMPSPADPAMAFVRTIIAGEIVPGGT